MSYRKAWKNDFIFDAYELSKKGMSEAQIAKALGVSLQTFRNWETQSPKSKQLRNVFGAGIRKGRSLAKRKRDGSSFSLQNFIAGRLPEELREYWYKINRCDSLKNGTERIEAILADGGVRVRQGLFFHAWMMSNYSFSAALRKVNISRSTFELWKKDPLFLQLLEHCAEIKGDFFEEYLVMGVAGGDSYLTKFANETYNRKRGYGKSVEIDVKGSININHNIISIDSLPLTLKEKKWLLEKIRRANTKQIESKTV